MFSPLYHTCISEPSHSLSWERESEGTSYEVWHGDLNSLSSRKKERRKSKKRADTFVCTSFHLCRMCILLSIARTHINPIAFIPGEERKMADIVGVTWRLETPSRREKTRGENKIHAQDVFFCFFSDYCRMCFVLSQSQNLFPLFLNHTLTWKPFYSHSRGRRVKGIMSRCDSETWNLSLWEKREGGRKEKSHTGKSLFFHFFPSSNEYVSSL